MVTESGDVSVPPGARWAALTAAGRADVEGRTANATRTVLNVSGKESIRVDVGEPEGEGRDATPQEERMVLIEWLFDSDDHGAH